MRTERKTHPCLECSSIFDRPSALKQHMALHTGEKAHTCTMCNKSFSVLSNLRRHMKSCGTLGRRRGQASSARILTPPSTNGGHSPGLHPSHPSFSDSPPSALHAHPYYNPHAAIDSDSMHPLATASWPPMVPEPNGGSFSTFPNPFIGAQAEGPPHWHTIPPRGQSSNTSHPRNCPSILRDSLEFLLVNQDAHLGLSDREYWVGELYRPDPMTSYAYHSTAHRNAELPRQAVVPADSRTVHNDGQFARHMDVGSYY